MRRILRFSFALAFVVAAFDAGLLKAAEIVSHRAEYRLFNGPQDTKAGRSVEENRVQCKAWVQISRTQMNGGRLMPADQLLKVDESKDGRRFTFSRRVTSAVKTNALLEGRAVQRDGKPPLATFTRPTPRDVTLPRGTVFPMSYYFKALDELQASPNKRMPRQPVFGILSRGANVLYAEARRVKDSGPLFSRIDGDTELLDSPAVDIELRLFESAKAAKPAYRIVIKLHANGVYSRAVYHLPLGTITAELAKIEALPKAKC
jgi:hypothetical protein